PSSASQPASPPAAPRFCSGAMSTPQIEGAKPSFLSRMGSKVTTLVASNLKPGTAIYSVMFGAAAGVLLSGVVYAGRTFSVMCFDHEYYKVQSRKRYYEKQLLFMREQEEVQSAHYYAALAGECPSTTVATRMPFKSLENKYRF
ncbi:unnamed protein product, partial [Prorocentrum cordatum]